MTAYQEFVNNPALKHGKTSILFEIEVDRTINDLIDFINNFLHTRGFKKTGHMKHEGVYNAVYNNLYIFGGVIQEENKIAVRINQI
jgi:hypothetical protein